MRKKAGGWVWTKGARATHAVCPITCQSLAVSLSYGTQSSCNGFSSGKGGKEEG